VTQPFNCRDVGSISGVSVVRPLSITKPRGLDKPMSRDVVLGIIDLGGCWVYFEDLESGKHNSTGRRSDGGENAVATVGDVHRCSGDRFVVFEVLQGYDPTVCLGCWQSGQLQHDNSIQGKRNKKGLTGNDILRDLSGVKGIGTLLGKANNAYCEQFCSKQKSILTVRGCQQTSFDRQYLPV